MGRDGGCPALDLRCTPTGFILWPMGAFHDPKPVSNPAALSALVEHLRERGHFSFDTEFVSEDTFEPELCLLQVATDERLTGIDPQAVSDLTPFWDVFLDPEVEVIMHAAGEDLRIARQQTGRVPEWVYDVQVAAAFVGLGYSLSLANLVGQVLGVSLVGGETRTDWRKRPLSQAQWDYALEDVRYLHDVADELEKRLVKMGRWDWFREEMREILDDIRQQDASGRWRRLPGLNSLSRRGLEIARRLFHWRLEDARASNRPLRQMMRDDLLVAIAKRSPKNRQELEALRDFNRPALLKRSDQILEMIRAASAVAPEELPEHADRPDDGPGMAMVSSLLSAALAHRCAKAKISVALVGTTQDLRELVRWHLEGRPTERRPLLASGWRAEVCGDSLLGVLDGSVALRVSDVRSDVPVELIQAD